jgi:hypothetical protein
MRRFLARFSESEASNHTLFLAGFTTTTLELKFSVHTPWHIARSKALSVGLSNAHFKSLGLLSLVEAR